ncbi:hypothetical protein HKX48_004429 [Thoreauomyces humboldtii]|nr:hypothetical protein HKX48_004429 [Thoreauomyces humboldtii]
MELPAEYLMSSSPDIPSLTYKNVAVASSFIFANALFSRAFGLGLEGTLIIAAARAVVQLTVMGQILQPVFQNENPWFVAGLAGLLASISVLEVYFNKTRHRHDWMFLTVAFSIVGSVGLVSFLGNAFAFGAEPWWRPRNYIPTLGMLLGNAISALAVGINGVLRQATENSDRIELALAYGASRWEAARPVVVESTRTAMLPVLNNMSVMGLISIPGMMTGQILGGAPIGDAVKYQQIIIFMITTSASLATLAGTLLSITIIFDDKARLRVDRIHKNVVNRTWSLRAIVEGWWRRLRGHRGGNDERTPLLAEGSSEGRRSPGPHWAKGKKATKASADADERACPSANTAGTSSA